MRKAQNVTTCKEIYPALLKPGMKYIDICDMLENKIVDLMGENTLNQGVGFYTSWSNEVIAHDSAIPDDKRVLEYNDVCKLDLEHMLMDL